MAKDKKKKKKKDKKGAKVAAPGIASRAAQQVKAASQNPLVADIVAAALVAAAAALKDSKKARQIAEFAGDELGELAKEGSKKGQAMWDLALDIGRRSLETLTSEAAPKPKPAATGAKSPRKPK